MYIFLLSNILLYYIFNKTLTALNLNYTEFLTKKYLVLYFFVLYSFIFYRSYALIPIIILSIIITLRVVENHPLYSFPMDNSALNLTFFGFLNYYIVFSIIKNSLLVLTLLV
jgi:hypothetical protein